MQYGAFTMSITGNIGSTETIAPGTEKEFSKINVACNGAYDKGDGSRVETVDWVEVILPKKADPARYTKGRLVYVTGIPKVNAYKNADGDAVGKQQIVSARVVLLDSKPAESASDEE